MRKYEGKTFLSVNPILDIPFLENIYESTPVPSLLKKQY